MDNIARIEGQKITRVSDKTIELTNGEMINLSDSKNIDCKVGDFISDYDDSNQSLICVRTDPNTGQKNNFFANVGSGIVGGIIGNYIASKLFARNNGLYFDQNSNSYRAPNGDVFTKQTNTQSGTTTTRTSYGRSTNGNTAKGGIFGGLFGGNSNSGGSNKSSGGDTTGSKSGTHVGSGGVSGSKGGSGGTSGGG